MNIDYAVVSDAFYETIQYLIQSPNFEYYLYLLMFAGFFTILAFHYVFKITKYLVDSIIDFISTFIEKRRGDKSDND